MGTIDAMMKMLNVNKYLITLLLALSAGTTLAQQDAMYSQYMFNPYAINPAYAGSREALSAVLLARSQWVGIDGAPTTQTLSVHGPFSGRKAAYGLHIVNDAIGPTRTTGAFASYAYHLPLGAGKLSFGLRGGVFNARLDRSMLEYQDPTDHFNNQGMVNAMVPSFDFGTYYYTRRFYAGLAVTHLTEQTIAYNDLPDGANINLQRHFIFGTGYAMSLNDDVVMKPSLLVRYVTTAPVNADVNLSFLFKKVFWLGASYRTSGSLVFISEYNITNFMRVGYSYDLVMGELSAYNKGSHEIFIGFDFAVGKKKMIDTRYL